MKGHAFALTLLTAFGPSSVPAFAGAEPAPVAAYEKGLRDDCLEAGGRLAPPRKDFLSRADLNGDGLMDWIFFEGGARCDGAASLYGGGTAGVGFETVIFVSLPGGGARQVTLPNFGAGAQEIQLERRRGKAVLWLVEGGNFCIQKPYDTIAEAASVTCDRALIWNKRQGRFDFAPLSQARFPSRIQLSPR